MGSMVPAEVVLVAHAPQAQESSKFYKKIFLNCRFFKINNLNIPGYK